MTNNEIINLLGQAPLFVTLYDASRKLLWSNRFGFGYDDSLTGKEDTEVIPAEFHETWETAVCRCLELRETVSGICAVAVANQKYIRMSFRMSPVIVDGNVLAYWVYSYPLLEAPEFSTMMKYLFSGIGKKILSVVQAKGPIKGAAIGMQIGEVTGKAASAKVKMLLGSMVDRDILERSPDGYEITSEFSQFLNQSGYSW